MEQEEQKQEWDVPLIAVLREGQDERPVFPLGISVERELYLSENPVFVPITGKWTTAYLIKRFVPLVLVELREGRAVFQI